MIATPCPRPRPAMVASGARRRRPAHHARGPRVPRRSPRPRHARTRAVELVITPVDVALVITPSGATAIATATTRTARAVELVITPVDVALVITPEATTGNGRQWSSSTSPCSSRPRPSVPRRSPRPRHARTRAGGAGHHARGHARQRMPEALGCHATPGDGRQWSPSTSTWSSCPRPSGATAIATATTRTGPRWWSWSSRPSTSPWSSCPRPRPAMVASGARRRRHAHHARGAAGDRHATPEATPGDGRQWGPSTSTCSSCPRRCR